MINTCSVLFFIDAGNNIGNAINLYITFSCFLSALIILSSSISIWTGLSPPAISKFCWARIMIVSISSYNGSFLFLSVLVKDRLWIFLSWRVGRFPLMIVSWKLKEYLFVSLLTKKLRKFYWLIFQISNFLFFFCWNN